MTEKKTKTFPEVIPFIRQRDYLFRKVLGSGACGQTILLYDDQIDEYFVCKKYAPHDESARSDLFENFRREIKLLYLLHHPNIVRVFNCYLYPERFAGFILMEYVEGAELNLYLRDRPEKIDSVFRQTIEGFAHLEQRTILHRDIRPQNILVSTSGDVKIIDFGFGKQITTPEDFDKSVSLNWWCDIPSEFSKGSYDFTTEVYFVGKLFEGILTEIADSEFTYTELLGWMCRFNPADRIDSFASCRRELIAQGISDPVFDANALRTYRDFSTNLAQCLTRIAHTARYRTDASDVLAMLEEIYPKIMLEQAPPDNNLVVRCFLTPPYSYRKTGHFSTWQIKEFLDFFRSCSAERRNIVLGNLHTRLDAVAHYDPTPAEDDDIPF